MPFGLSLRCFLERRSTIARVFAVIVGKKVMHSRILYGDVAITSDSHHSYELLIYYGYNRNVS